MDGRNRGWPSNDALLGELFELRHEQATLLGYAGWPDFHAEDKMIGNGHAIAAFLEPITEAADAPAHQDFLGRHYNFTAFETWLAS